MIAGWSYGFTDTVECRVGSAPLSASMCRNLSALHTRLELPMNLYHVWPACEEPDVDGAVEIFHRFAVDMEAQRLQGRLHYARIDDRIVHRAERAPKRS